MSISCPQSGERNEVAKNAATHAKKAIGRNVDTPIFIDGRQRPNSKVPAPDTPESPPQRPRNVMVAPKLATSTDRSYAKPNAELPDTASRNGGEHTIERTAETTQSLRLNNKQITGVIQRHTAEELALQNDFEPKTVDVYCPGSGAEPLADKRDVRSTVRPTDEVRALREFRGRFAARRRVLRAAPQVFDSDPPGPVHNLRLHPTEMPLVVQSRAARKLGSPVPLRTV